MWLNIIAFLLVVAITFLHSTFSFFSGLINVVCSIAAACIAFGFLEPVNDLLTGRFGLHSSYSEPCALIGLFVLSLALLRYLADNYIRGNLSLPRAVDVTGAVICGFINAQIAVGMLMIGIQMLPLGGRVLGFSRYERVEDENNPDHPEMPLFERRHLWTRPDEFTVALVKLVSGGALRGEVTFGDVYPDFIDEVWFTTNTVQPESLTSPLRDKKGDGFKAVQVLSWWEESGPLEVRYRRAVPTADKPRPPFKPMTFKPAAGKKLLGVRIKLGRAAADRSGRSSLHLFRPTMIRLVGELNGRPVHYIPIVLNTGDPALDGANRLVDPDNNISIPGGDVEVDAYFEVDPGFKPRFVEYRRHARAVVPAEKFSKTGPSEPLALQGSKPGRRRGGRGGGLTFGRVISRSIVGPQLPWELNGDRLRRQPNVELDGEALVHGRVSGALDGLRSREGSPIVRLFKIPEGYGLLQIRYRPKEARSLAGQVFRFVSRLNQYYVLDDGGTQRPMVGYYAKIRRGRDDYIELFYNGPPDNPLDPGYRNMLDFKTLKFNEVYTQDDSEIGMLFLVPKGRRVVRFQNQNGEGQDVNFEIR